MAKIDVAPRVGEKLPPRLAQRPIKPSRTRDVDDVGGHALLVQPLRRRYRLWHHDAAGRDLDRIPGRQIGRGHTPVDNALATKEGLAAHLVLPQWSQCLVHQRLVDRFGRKPEVARETVLAVAALA